MNLSFSPVDTCFFRSGAPFDVGFQAHGALRGLFPPNPPTLVGALRTALTLTNGHPDGSWAGFAAGLQGLEITGPYLLFRGEPVFPLPRHVAGRLDVSDGRFLPQALLRPGPEVDCDLGPQRRLPALPDGVRVSKELVAGEDFWVTLTGLRRILRGKLPEAPEILAADTLWTTESRIGIQRGRETRAVLPQGGIYSTRHVRPRAGLEIGFAVEGLPSGWQRPDGVQVPLGGEGRFATCEVRPGAGLELLAQSVETDAAGGFLLIALTPLLLGQGVVAEEKLLPLRTPNCPFRPARIVSACSGRPLRIGGWDGGAGAPLPMRDAIPPGSALFCKLDDRNGEGGPPSRRLESGLQRVGARTAAGFGLCAVGPLPGQERNP